MRIDYYTYSDSGGRENNEDAVGAKVYDDRGIFVVADGLGGYVDGEIASKCVVDTVLDSFIDEPADSGSKYIARVLAEANDSIMKLQRTHGCIMKSTAVAMMIDSETVTWGHVGDSRLYYIHDNTIKYITHDHSVAYKKYAAGEISRSQIRTDEDQPGLLRTLGSRDRYEAEIYGESVRPEQGDAFMLCTDGLWVYLEDDEVLADRLKARDARDWAGKLLARVNERVDGYNDNLSLITVIVN